jgi:hypothetical protein
MRWPSDGRIAFYAIIFFGFWLFVVLPILHSQAPICSDPEKLTFWQKTGCDPVAYFTLWLMIFTAALGAATIGLLFATNRTAQIAERALTEHERPWLFFSGATIQLRFMPLTGLPPANHFYVELHFENVGRAPALVDACEFQFIDKDDLPNSPDYSQCQPLNTDRAIRTGGKFSTNQVGPTIAMKNGTPINYVMFGRLRYRELMGKEHVVGFAIEIAPHMPAFVSSSNKAYEYYT